MRSLRLSGSLIGLIVLLAALLVGEWMLRGLRNRETLELVDSLRMAGVPFVLSQADAVALPLIPRRDDCVLLSVDANSSVVDASTIGGMHHQLQLERLHIAGAPVTDADIKSLERLSRIRSIDLSGTPVTDECLSAMGRWDLLSCLFLARTQIRGHSLRELQSCTPYRIVDLRNTECAEADLIGFVSVRSIERLYVDRLAITDRFIDNLGQTTSSITTLSIAHTEITPTGVANAISRCPNLSIIILDGIPLSLPEEAIGYTSTDKIRAISIGPLLPMDLQATMAQFSHLWALRLKECVVSEKVLSLMQQNFALKSLTLSDCTVDGDMLAEYINSTGIEELNINTTEITPFNWWWALTANVRLRRVTIYRAKDETSWADDFRLYKGQVGEVHIIRSPLAHDTPGRPGAEGEFVASSTDDQFMRFATRLSLSQDYPQSH